MNAPAPSSRTSPLRDGFSLQFGEVEIRALETPGHTPESTCLLVFDREKSADKPWAALTGDTLFIGDVGRPDLAEGYTPQQLAGDLYDSLHQKLLTLPDDVLVYPAHGAGSLCGRNMRADRFSTIGTERLTNAALQVKTRDDFIRELTTHLPPRPQYFAEDAAINREGAEALQDLRPLPALSPDDVREAQAHGYVLLDTRAGDDFARGHVPGSVNIGLGGQFASWAGTVLGLGAKMIIIAESDEKAAEARLRLARVGIEHVIGYLKDGVRGWEEAGNSLEKIPQITAAQLRDRLQRTHRARCSPRTGVAGGPHRGRALARARRLSPRPAGTRPRRAHRGALQERLPQHHRRQPAAPRRLPQRHRRARRIRCVGAGCVSRQSRSKVVDPITDSSSSVRARTYALPVSTYYRIIPSLLNESLY